LSGHDGTLSVVTQLHRPGEPELTPISPQSQQALAADLARLDDLQHRKGVTTFAAAAAGSRAARDIADQARAYAHDHASGRISAALDHLVAWRALLLDAQIMPMYAHMSLLRTAHEAALLALWLVDPSINDDTRRARGIATQLADYKERKKFEDSVGGPRMPLQGKSAADRINDLMTTATGLGLTKTNRRGDIVLATDIPATVDLFDIYETDRPMLKGQFIYRLQSGYAHAKQWALTQGAERAGPLDASERTIAKIEPSDRLGAHLTTRCVNAVERALSAYESLRSPPSTAP
jgi:hypothetical protein